VTLVRRTFTLLLKLAVSIGALVYLFSTTDVSALLERVRGGDTLLLALAAIAYLVVLAISTWRWQLLLKAQGYPAPLRQLSASYLVATFFNNFFPSNIGGDVVRVADGKQLTGCLTTSLAVVAIDRIVGFGALYFLAALAFAFGGSDLRALPGARIIVIGLGVLFVLLAYVYFRPGTARRLLASSGLASWQWIRERFETIQGAVHAYRAQPGVVVGAFLGSVALQAALVLYFFLVAHSLGIQLQFTAAFLMVPLCGLIQAVPISFNGWGIRESVFILYFHHVGLPREAALAFSLVGAGLIVLLSLSGAVVWTSRGRELGGSPQTTEPVAR
jgi:glycosyltransferase 2 family protein